MQALINFTNAKLNNWYTNAKLDYNVEGSATAKIENGQFIVEAIENGVSKVWSMVFYPEYVRDNGFDYFYNVWMEQAK